MFPSKNVTTFHTPAIAFSELPAEALQHGEGSLEELLTIGQKIHSGGRTRVLMAERRRDGFKSISATLLRSIMLLSGTGQIAAKRGWKGRWCTYRKLLTLHQENSAED